MPPNNYAQQCGWNDHNCDLNGKIASTPHKNNTTRNSTEHMPRRINVSSSICHLTTIHNNTDGTIAIAIEIAITITITIAIAIAME